MFTQAIASKTTTCIKPLRQPTVETVGYENRLLSLIAHHFNGGKGGFNGGKGGTCFFEVFQQLASNTASEPAKLKMSSSMVLCHLIMSYAK